MAATKPQSRHAAGRVRPLGRRAALGGLAALIAAGAHAATNPTRFPDGGAILIGGPKDGALSLWARRIATALLEGQPAGAVLHRHAAGGPDGVTAANRFQASVPPDGQTALLAPGAAALAWLAGDPRAHFDVAKWLPVMAALSPGVVCAKPPGVNLPAGARLRIAASGPTGRALPALLAAELLGLVPVPVFGLRTPAAARDALAAGRVDAVLAGGADADAELAALAAAGAAPVFSFGCPVRGGGLARDPLMAQVPTLDERAVSLRGRTPAGPLYAAWRAAASAACLDFALVLPVLASPAMVALWRKAARRLVALPQLQAPGLRLLAAPDATPVLQTIAPDAAVLLALRRWMDERLSWKPA